MPVAGIAGVCVCSDNNISTSVYSHVLYIGTCTIYGGATVSRIDTIIGLLCRIQSLL